MLLRSILLFQVLLPAEAGLVVTGFIQAGSMVCCQGAQGTWSVIKQTAELRQASGNVCIDEIDWWNSVICSNRSVSHSWYLAGSAGPEICLLCSFKFISLRHAAFTCREISCSVSCFFFLTEVLMNTKTETSDLKWTIYSTARPEVRNPGFTLLSVLLTRTVWRLGIFGFQLFLCYLGYKRVPYMAC